MDGEDSLEMTVRRWGDALVGVLLADRAMGRPIRWATDSFAALGKGFGRWEAMTPARVRRVVRLGALRPRAAKAAHERQARVRAHGEVFTPAWVCKRMTDVADAPWLRKDSAASQPDMFLRAALPPTALRFRPRRRWKDYVRQRRLEITCGEAPFLTARYDADTGEPIPWEQRYGFLDRKLRALPPCLNRAYWQRWAGEAFAATYGYEYQGDNLFLARVNLLLTFEEAHRARWGGAPAPEALRAIAETLSWNLWQMDGLTGLPPCESASEEGDLFAIASSEPPSRPCRLRVAGKKCTLDAVKGERTMKFDFVIGNPPYQGETKGLNATYAPPYTLVLSVRPMRSRIAWS